MLNYFERIDDYKRKLYFQVNGKFIDFYTPKINQWSQNLQIISDILQFASETDIQDSYGVLNIRFFAGMPSIEDQHKLMDILSLANFNLADKLGENDITKSLGLSKRHFSAIVFNEQMKKKVAKPEKVIEQELPKVEEYVFPEQEVKEDESEPKRRKYSRDTKTEISQ